MKKERDRLLHGLANAKAKGIRIGRLKKRDSDLIRKLKASGMTYRQIAHIARCSAGAVGAEMRVLRAEKIVQENINKELDEKTKKIKLDHSFIPESNTDNEFQEMRFDLNKELPKIQLELER